MAYKKLSEATFVENIMDTANVLIEENDEIKRVPKSEVGSGVKCWDELEDKPFGEKTSRVNHLKPTEMDGFEQGEEWHEFWFDGPNYLELEEPVILGEKYTLVYDGVEYSATVQDEENSVFFGINYYWTGDRFDDLPFGVLLSAKYDSELDTRFGTKVQCVFTDSSAAKTHTLEIYKDNVEITPLPKKYLPASIYIDENNNVITDITRSELKDAFESKRPFEPRICLKSDNEYYFRPLVSVTFYNEEDAGHNRIDVYFDGGYFVTFEENGEVIFSETD